ncbi:hypothetical protein BLW93_08480 [Desulfurobacterium indicum]|uniref:Helix-turn-helix domain-containing protein n=1 Tax=Desulfurobacterium indicum TaxID=1914305 RepID=A0A1R1MJ69_9BACT|nr:hypothetical protein BLW93_08480 [Desulfurobacterium indicum]
MPPGVGICGVFPRRLSHFSSLHKISYTTFKTLKKYYSEGLIAAKKIGNKWLWDRYSIDAFFGEDDLKAEALLQGVLQK